MSIVIGPARIADVDGTHEPGETVENPSQALRDLAAAKTCDPATGLPYVVDFERTTRAAKAPPVITPDPTPEPDPEPVAAATPAEEAAP